MKLLQFFALFLQQLDIGLLLPQLINGLGTDRCNTNAYVHIERNLSRLSAVSLTTMMMNEDDDLPVNTVMTRSSFGAEVLHTMRSRSLSIQA